ncbi:MAG: class I SAM-dependent methyltransferase [Dehalococcoidales bacterium]|nr:class I SAM-dependent methyltransferase [Dehalococcoidales bacterium]
MAIGNEDYRFHLAAQESWDKYIWAARFVSHKSVLDVACAHGFGSNLLIESGASQVIGGDIARASLLVAKENYKKQNLSFVQLDACNLPFSSDYFDVVVTLETIEHLPEYKKFLSECSRVLKPKGLLICSTPNKEAKRPFIEVIPSKGLDLGHVKEFDSLEFRDLLKEYFTEVDLYGYLPLNLAERMKRKLAHIIAETGKALLLLPVPQGVKLKIRYFAACFLFRPVQLEKAFQNIETTRFSISPFNASLNQANLIALGTKKAEGKT